MQEDSCFILFINFLFTEYPFIGVEEIAYSEQTLQNIQGRLRFGPELPTRMKSILLSGVPPRTTEAHAKD